jgi:hypothetical protein
MNKDSKQASGNAGFFKRTIQFLKSPSSHHSFGFLVIGGMILVPCNNYKFG